MQMGVLMMFMNLNNITINITQILTVLIIAMLSRELAKVKPLIYCKMPISLKNVEYYKT